MVSYYFIIVHVTVSLIVALIETFRVSWLLQEKEIPRQTFFFFARVSEDDGYNRGVKRYKETVLLLQRGMRVTYTNKRPRRHGHWHLFQSHSLSRSSVLTTGRHREQDIKRAHLIVCHCSRDATNGNYPIPILNGAKAAVKWAWFLKCVMLGTTNYRIISQILWPISPSNCGQQSRDLFRDFFLPHSPVVWDMLRGYF